MDTAVGGDGKRVVSRTAVEVEVDDLDIVTLLDGDGRDRS